MNNQSIISYFIVGLIATIFGGVSINVILEEDKRKKYNVPRTYILFFIIGIILHIIVQSINLDEIYCDKQCQLRLLRK
jgi:H+/Cl- antiporter ClcA